AAVKTGPPPSAPAQPDTPPTPPDAPDAEPDPAPYAVTRIDVTLVDDELGGRTVDAAVWYPQGGGAVPLVVVAHGFATNPDTYGTFLTGLASAGYVVVAPRSVATRAYLGGGGGEAPQPEPSPEESASSSALQFVQEDDPADGGGTTDAPADQNGESI